MASRRSVFALVVFLTLLGAVALFAAMRLHHPVTAGGAGQLLVYDVPGDIDESAPVFNGFTLSALRRDRPTLHEVTSAIRAAAEDEDVKGMVLHIGGIGWGWARIAEMREALGVFRAAGKPIYASLEGGSEGEYLLASSANHIAMPQTSLLQLDGLTASAMFLKGAYDKLGITPNYAHVGQFKSAVEQYTRTDLSPPARAAMEALLDDEYRVLVDSLAAARGVSGDSLRHLIDEGPYTAPTAIAAGLVDTLLDESDVDSLAAGHGSHALEVVTMTHYLDRATAPSTGSHIALVVASGTIMGGKSTDSPFNGRQLGSETLVAALREARERKSIKAVVLRIDSPGGSGQASEEVWQEVRRVRRSKPVIVSMGNLAASGGYYIACGADAIVAEPNTLTGSIGVFGGKLNLLGLYQKLGLNIETVSRGKHAEMFSSFKDFTPEEAQRFQAQMDAFYQVFIGRVADGRHMTKAQVDSIGQGRVWSGLQGRRLGLVDSLGGLQTAVAIARARAHIAKDADVLLDVYPQGKRTYFQRMLGNMFDDHDDESRLLLLTPVMQAWIEASRFPTGTALALMPYSIDIH